MADQRPEEKCMNVPPLPGTTLDDTVTVEVTESSGRRRENLPASRGQAGEQFHVAVRLDGRQIL